jgi:hypothetical protein
VECSIGILSAAASLLPVAVSVSARAALTDGSPLLKMEWRESLAAYVWAGDAARLLGLNAVDGVAMSSSTDALRHAHEIKEAIF